MESYSSLSIEELVRRCSASRSADAWEEFVRRFHRLIATVILRTAARLGDSSKADRRRSHPGNVPKTLRR